ncbi:MAG: Amidohydrolase 2, partial [Rhizobacter sp.]|nr:Amidohydrolase 2 [Rhizobacter sp.]
MIIDAHVHCSGQEKVDDVLQSIDDAGIDMAVVLAPFLSEGFSIDDAESLVRANEHVAQLVKHEEDRLV